MAQVIIPKHSLVELIEDSIEVDITSFRMESRSMSFDWSESSGEESPDIQYDLQAVKSVLVDIDLENIEEWRLAQQEIEETLAANIQLAQEIEKLKEQNAKLLSEQERGDQEYNQMAEDFSQLHTEHQKLLNAQKQGDIEYDKLVNDFVTLNSEVRKLRTKSWFKFW